MAVAPLVASKYSVSLSGMAELLMRITKHVQKIQKKIRFFDVIL